MSNEDRQLLGPWSQKILGIEVCADEKAPLPPGFEEAVGKAAAGFDEGYREFARGCLVAGLPVHKLGEWQWLVRPPWWRPFQRRRYDKKIAEGGIGYYAARVVATDAASLPPIVLLYRRPSLWRRLVWKLEKRRIERTPKPQSDQETKETK